ncbi:PQQ-binding-like beta-propeller repeat protein [Nocardiopsis sp. EMB25]|uniref:PQQ-binding-like beta-propeller repeat protein n=1 Tax=Nocardiopsis sp. EMB25 TaxID=2835867 RepID=UPI002283E7B3|nr:PQQ-binding-like beta-propeller repeat protein [Nocardiopsis sp. EMB25]MCY9785885.1 PQQ-binding-like beta-propeller repeat protein [Nocardiopsis sp. EMB25]
MRNKLVLVAVVLGLVPSIVHFAVADAGALRAPTPIYITMGVAAISGILLFGWALSWWSRFREKWFILLLWFVSVLAILLGGTSLANVIGQWSAQLRLGEVYELTLVLLVTASVCLVQVLISIWLATNDMKWPRPRRITSAVLAVGVMASLGMAVDISRGSSVQSTLSSGSEENPDIPSGVSEVSWRLELPEGESAYRVWPISSGALIGLTSGALVINPDAGTESWRYRWPGANARLGAAPWGENVVSYFTTYEQPDGVEETSELVGLDSASGRVNHAESYPFEYPHPERRLTLPQRSISLDIAGDTVVRADAGSMVSGFSATSGEHVWDFDGSPSCQPDTSMSDSGSTRFFAGYVHVFVPVYCLADDGGTSGASRVVVHTVNAATGELEWVYEDPISSGGLPPNISVSHDGTRVYFDHEESQTFAVADSATGEMISSGEREDFRIVGSVPGGSGAMFLVRNGSTYTLAEEGALSPDTITLSEGSGHDVSATSEALYVVDWASDGSGPATVTVYPWDGSEPSSIEDVFGRDLSEDESARIQVVPGGVMVSAFESFLFTELVALR